MTLTPKSAHFTAKGVSDCTSALSLFKSRCRMPHACRCLTPRASCTQMLTTYGSVSWGCHGRSKRQHRGCEDTDPICGSESIATLPALRRARECSYLELANASWHASYIMLGISNAHLGRRQRLQVRSQRAVAAQLHHDPHLAVGCVEAEAVHLQDVGARPDEQGHLHFIFWLFMQTTSQGTPQSQGGAPLRADKKMLMVT